MGVMTDDVAKMFPNLIVVVAVVVSICKFFSFMVKILHVLADIHTE